MRRSQINRAYSDALACFGRNGWALPPGARWDITDFGLGDFGRHGLTLVNLATEPEYCEKLMHARRGQETPCHAHLRKKEDIICRAGELSVSLWPSRPGPGAPKHAAFKVALNGVPVDVLPGEPIALQAGSRVTIVPGIWHSFVASSEDCIIGEVSTANDDLRDNHFLDPGVGRFPAVEEDEPRQVRLEGDTP
jgi:D-lyxose ketol-isomerase